MSGARGVAEAHREQRSTHLNAEVTKALRQALSEMPPDPVYRVGQLLTDQVVGAPPPSSTPAGAVLDYNAIWFDHVNAVVTRAMKQTLLQRPDNPVVYIGRLLLAASSTGAAIAIGARGWAVGTPSSTEKARVVATEQPENPRLVTELQQQLAAAKDEVLSLRLNLKELGAANANAATPSAPRAALAPSPAKLTLLEDDSAGASDKWNLPKWSRGAGVHRVIAAALQQAMADTGLGADAEASVAEAAAALAAAQHAQDAADANTTAEESAAAETAEEVAALEAALEKARQVQADAVLSFLKGLNGRGELDALLRTEAVMDGLVDLLWQEVMQLQTAGAPTSKDIQGKFAGSIEMSYSGLDTFFSGLEGVIGTPNAKLFAAMESEHTMGVDATQEFTTGCDHNPTLPSHRASTPSPLCGCSRPFTTPRPQQLWHHDHIQDRVGLCRRRRGNARGPVPLA